jgi:replicative DNA helicase
MSTTTVKEMKLMERSLPADITAERATLGSILLDRDAIIAIASWLPAEYFYLEKHAWIYEAMLACFNQRIPPDMSTVADELRRNERLELVGGIMYLGELSAEVPTPVHIEYYARIVERTALLRRLIEAGGRISALGYNERDDVEQTLDKAEAELFQVSQRRAMQDFVHIRRVIDTYFEQINSLEEERADLVGIPTGYIDLDKLTGGMQRSDLVIIAARPSVGKTALALSMVYNVAVKANHTVAIFSLEMSREQLVQRLLAMHTGIDTQRLRTGNIAREMPTIIEAMGVLSEASIYIEDTPGLSIMEVRSRARRLQSQAGIDMIIVDYLQLMQANRTDNRVQEVSEISRGLKALARELNVPVLALSQLSRAVEGRVNRVPLLSDLRESGSIEQDADIVMFIYREELYDKDTDKKGIAEIHLAKHRNGPLGVVPLRFENNTTTFQNLARYTATQGY